MPQSSSHTAVLADQIFRGEGLRRDAIRILAANLLLVLCARIIIPLPWTPVPITGQTFGVLFVAILLGSRRSAAVMGLYLVEGLAGLPVFAPIGLPGITHFFGPTAGYLFSYPIAAFVTGWLVERGAEKKILYLLCALVAGEIIIFTSGCAWLAAPMHFGWSKAFVAGVAPFLPGDAIKTLLVIAAVRGVELARRDARLSGQRQ
jgi:biotin transport system substrate-specific component